MYITSQDMIDRVGDDAAVQLTSDSGGAVDTAVLDAVRLEAEGEVDSNLARRYLTPVDLTAFPAVAAALKGAVLDIAVYKLLTRRTGSSVSEPDRQKYTDAIAWLEKVAKGEVLLPGAKTPTATTADEPSFSHGGDERRFD